MNPPEAPPPPFAVPIPERMGAATSVCVIANPGAGRGGRRAALEAAVDRWARRGWTIRWRTTGAPGDATAMARSAAADGVDVVAVAGGDGTVNEAVNGLVGARAALAVLPSGTANVLAAQLGLVPWPSPWRTPDLGAAADALAAGVVRSVDLGFAEPAGRPGRHFVMWAGVGADAAVVAALEEPGHKALNARLGAVAYAIAGVRVLLSDRGGRAMVCVDGVRRRGRLRCAVVNNIPLYAGLVHLAPEARLDDGRLDAALFMGASRLRAAADWLSAGGSVRRRPSGAASSAAEPTPTARCRWGARP
ncbi:MAG: diacylglycerol kinase family protein [Anaerolineae bacterium]